MLWTLEEHCIAVKKHLENVGTGLWISIHKGLGSGVHPTPWDLSESANKMHRNPRRLTADWQIHPKEKAGITSFYFRIISVKLGNKIHVKLPHRWRKSSQFPWLKYAQRLAALEELRGVIGLGYTIHLLCGTICI